MDTTETPGDTVPNDSVGKVQVPVRAPSSLVDDMNRLRLQILDEIEEAQAVLRRCHVQRLDMLERHEKELAVNHELDDQLLRRRDELVARARDEANIDAAQIAAKLQVTSTEVGAYVRAHNKRNE